MIFICSDILREPTHHKTTRAFFEQPSIVLQRIGDVGQMDQGGHMAPCNKARPLAP